MSSVRRAPRAFTSFAERGATTTISGQHERRDEQDRQDAPEVVDRIGGLVDVGGHVAERHVQRNHREWQCDQEDGAPVEFGEQRARQKRAERGDGATEGGPQRDRLCARRSRPQRRDEGERRREGHAGREPADEAREEQHLDRRREGGDQGRRDRQRRAEDEHQLAPVAVTQRAEVEHGRGETERVTDGNQVELRLPGVERLADVRQRDVGHGQVQVRDRRDEDERDEDHARTRGRALSLAGRRPI
jgi:hypothetical protein